MELVLGALVIVGLIIMVFSCGYEAGRDRARRDAIEAGVGEWVVDDKLTGETVFKWRV